MISLGKGIRYRRELDQIIRRKHIIEDAVGCILEDILRKRI